MSSGFSEVIGSWKIIETFRPRISRIDSGSSVSRSRPLEQDASLHGRGPRRQQPHDRQRGYRLARAGLADDRHDLAGRDREAHAFDGTHHAGRGAEPHAQIFDRKQGRVRGNGRRGRLDDAPTFRVHGRTLWGFLPIRVFSLRDAPPGAALGRAAPLPKKQHRCKPGRAPQEGRAGRRYGSAITGACGSGRPSRPLPASRRARRR